MQSLKKGSNVLKRFGEPVKFPEKFKGTIVEKWADYWKNLFIDYRQMLQDLRSDIQEEPLKALKWTTGFAITYALAKNNPNEMDFKNELKKVENEVALVPEDCLSKKSLEYLRYVETCYNEGAIHYQSLGIFSLMYVSELSDSCDLYKAHCSYMKPTFISYPSLIVDVGIMGKWWNLHKKTSNFDVNF